LKRNSTAIQDLEIIEFRPYPDNRGTFREVFRRQWLPEIFDEEVQMNCSISRPGVIRGLHYHRRQWDLWIPVQGELRAGLADLRQDSSTRGEVMTLDLRGDGNTGILIPPGVAHGFAAHTDVTLIYVVSRYYDSADEYGVPWNDPDIGIDWGIDDPIVSQRDKS